jgi:hypothetical protein
MKGWQPIDYMVGLLVVTLMVLLLMIMGEMVFDDRNIGDAGAKRINVIINSMVAIISMYVGAQIQKGKDK